MLQPARQALPADRRAAPWLRHLRAVEEGGLEDPDVEEACLVMEEEEALRRFEGRTAEAGAGDVSDAETNEENDYEEAEGATAVEEEHNDGQEENAAEGDEHYAADVREGEDGDQWGREEGWTGRMP